MPDYGEAFQEGLKAARDAEGARTEISAILDEFTKQVLQNSGGKLRIGTAAPGEIRGPSDSLLEGAPKGQTLVLFAENPEAKSSPKRGLAGWSGSSGGYPCRVSWGYQVHLAEDREGLERVLDSLLRDPAIGQKLQGLMDLQAATKR